MRLIQTSSLSECDTALFEEHTDLESNSQHKGIGCEEARFDEQIIDFLREAETGMAIKELCRRCGFSGGSCDLLS
jgi:hypothetical protein